MADWNKPDLNSAYTNWPSEVNDKVANSGKLDYGSDTNLPTGLLRYNRSLKRLEEWSGAAWVAMEITNLADGAVSATAKLANSVVTNTKLSLPVGAFSSVTLTPNTGAWTPGTPHQAIQIQIGEMAFLQFRLNGSLSLAATYITITTSPALPGTTAIVPTYGRDLSVTAPAAALIGEFNPAGPQIETRRADGVNFASGSRDFSICAFVRLA